MHIPLLCRLQEGRALKDSQLQVVRELLPPNPTWERGDPDGVALLAMETVQQGNSCLVFCASKFATEACAKMVARLIGEHMGPIPQRGAAAAATAAAAAQAGLEVTPAGGQQTPGPGTGAGLTSREAILAELKQLTHGEETPLTQAIAKGVAFHHRGLTTEECKLVEVAYGSGAVSVLCCTSTMAIGVNLPARRVIFRHPYIGQPDNPINVAQ